MTRIVTRSAKQIARARPPTAFIPATRLTDSKPTASTSTKSNTSAAPKRTVKRTRDAAPAPNSHKVVFASKVVDHYTKAIAEDKPHFRVGEKQIYFPTAKVVLLRPNAKHTPFQAKFVVPRYFNKLDLRDYLYHVYGLRALNVTTQLLWARWKRETPRSPRHRDTQIKKMTIEMEEPFVWPAEPERDEINRSLNLDLHLEMDKYAEDVRRLGSDQYKPPTAFGGLVGPFPPAPQPFIPKHVKHGLEETKRADELADKRQYEEELVKKFLKL